MVGAILGALLGGVAGALAGAVVLALPVAALRLITRSNGAAVSRLSVVLWSVAGAWAGALVGALVAGGDPARTGNAVTNWAIVGAILCGGYRLWRRARS